MFTPKLSDDAVAAEALRKAPRPDHAGLSCSMWMNVSPEGNTGTWGKACYVRETFFPEEGTGKIMPRRRTVNRHKKIPDRKVFIAPEFKDLRILSRRLGR
ncbi:hypothetical protein CMUS01_16453 [Colletotrichum musicola]|uniref:Uncharacterized protein n=1 Tax=Colletotrichum musicola TaxID=2175873 RepID=A0A8H6IN23_9PEZI|nr:hypothetical protein CMUS01_16453 [Colletotrichum musicola]